MPRFIVERNNMAAAFAVRLHMDDVRLARSFLLRGKVFDVYVAADRDAFDWNIERPNFLGVASDD